MAHLPPGDTCGSDLRGAPIGTVSGVGKTRDCSTSDVLKAALLRPVLVRPLCTSIRGSPCCAWSPLPEAAWPTLAHFWLPESSPFYRAPASLPVPSFRLGRVSRESEGRPPGSKPCSGDLSCLSVLTCMTGVTIGTSVTGPPPGATQGIHAGASNPAPRALSVASLTCSTPWSPTGKTKRKLTS